jgi:hypothetical protein
LFVGLGFSGLVLGGSGPVLPCLFAVLLVALHPLAHELGGCVPASCGFALIARLVVGLDDAFARFGWVDGRNLLVGKFPRWRVCYFARGRSDSAGGAPPLFECG